MKDDELAVRRPDQADSWALEGEAYRASDAEIAAMPDPVRRSFLAHRAKMDAVQAAREARYARELSALRHKTNLLNRTQSVRSVTGPNGERLHVAFCACGFHGLQVADPHYSAEKQAEVRAKSQQFSANLRDPKWVDEQKTRGVPQWAIDLYRDLDGGGK